MTNEWWLPCRRHNRSYNKDHASPGDAQLSNHLHVMDYAVLPTQTAMEVPYTRGRCQEPIGERVIVNDFYGIPLYKPAVGPFEPDLGTGAVAAKKIIAETGDDPNFVFDQAKRDPERASAYEMMFRPQKDPGPMRYTCRMEDCCAVGGSDSIGLLHGRRAGCTLEYLPCGGRTLVHVPGRRMQGHVHC